MGYAQFPFDYLTKPNTDGVVIRSTAFGRIGSVIAPFNLGRTATHEVGHWLNLFHISGDANCGNDFVDDTPPQGTLNLGCRTFPNISCNNAPNGDMFMNYMDYSDDACMNIYTSGQRIRMRSIFAQGGPRADFINNYFRINQPTNRFCSSVSLNATNPLCLSVTWTIISGSATITGGQGTNTVNIQTQAGASGTFRIRATAGEYVDEIDVNFGVYLSDIDVRYSRNSGPNQMIDFGSTNSKTIYTQTGNFRVQTSSLMPGSNTFSWTRISGNSGWSNYSSNNAICNFTLSGPNAPTIVLKTTLTNTLNGCTSSNDKFVVFVASIPLSGRVIASPNPTKGDINLTFTEPLPLEFTSSNLRKEADPMPLRSVNSTGKTIVSLFEFNTSLLVKEFTKTDINSKSYQLNLAGLRKGLYIMQVDRNNLTSVTKIIIE